MPNQDLPQCHLHRTVFSSFDPTKGNISLFLNKKKLYILSRESHNTEKDRFKYIRKVVE